MFSPRSLLLSLTLTGLCAAGASCEGPAGESPLEHPEQQTVSAPPEGLDAAALPRPEAGAELVPDAGPVLTLPDAGNELSVADASTERPLPAVSFAAQVQPIFAARCGGCHITRSAGGLSLAPAVAWANLVNAISGCDGATLVKPGAPAQSALLLKLAGDPASCGAVMPPRTAGLKALAPEEFARLERWVLEGALNN